MASREELHEKLKAFAPNIYFQPPSGFKMSYPCVVYNKTGRMRHYADNIVYLSQHEYLLTVIDKDPDSDIADVIESSFQSCAITQYYTVENLNHVSLTLYY